MNFVGLVYGRTPVGFRPTSHSYQRACVVHHIHDISCLARYYVTKIVRLLYDYTLRVVYQHNARKLKAKLGNLLTAFRSITPAHSGL